MAAKKKDNFQIFPFLEWENLSFYIFSTTTDYQTAEKTRTIMLINERHQRTFIRTYAIAQPHSHVRVNVKPFVVSDISLDVFLIPLYYSDLRLRGFLWYRKQPIKNVSSVHSKSAFALFYEINLP